MRSVKSLTESPNRLAELGVGHIGHEAAADLLLCPGFMMAVNVLIRMYVLPPHFLHKVLRLFGASSDMPKKGIP